MEQAQAEFPRFVQVVLPAPAADVLQRACRMATESLLTAAAELQESVDAAGEDDTDERNAWKIQIHESTRLTEQLDQLAEFFDDIAANPEMYPVKGHMSASIKARQRAWRAVQPKKPSRKKGQSRRAYEARVARWSRARQEDVAEYNAATQQLILADLPVDANLLRLILEHGLTTDQIKEQLQSQADEEAKQQAKYEAALAVLQAQDEEIQDGAPEIIIPA